MHGFRLSLPHGFMGSVRSKNRVLESVDGHPFRIGSIDRDLEITFTCE